MTWRTKESLERGLAAAGPQDLAGLWSTIDIVVGRDHRALSAAALATMAAAAQDRPTALSMLSDVALRHGRCGFQHTALAFYQRELGDDGAALASFRQATRLDPEYAEAWLGLGILLDDQGDAASLPALERAVTLEPESVEAWKRLGDAQAARGRYHQAIDAYERGLALQPHHSRLAFHRCRALGALGHFDEAVASTPRAIVRDLGQLRQVERLSEGRVFVCRYWAADDVADLFEVLAESILEAATHVVAADVDLSEGMCLDLGSAPLRIVPRAGRLVVCDADGGHELRLDRFGEMNEAISLLHAQQACLRSAGLDGESCRWTDLVRVQPGALEQTHLRMRRMAPKAGVSGWILASDECEASAESGWIELPVYALRRQRPAISRFLALPPGVDVEVEGALLRRVAPLAEPELGDDEPIVLH